MTLEFVSKSFDMYVFHIFDKHILFSFTRSNVDPFCVGNVVFASHVLLPVERVLQAVPAVVTSVLVHHGVVITSYPLVTIAILQVRWKKTV